MVDLIIKKGYKNIIKLRHQTKFCLTSLHPSDPNRNHHHSGRTKKKEKGVNYIPQTWKNMRICSNANLNHYIPHH